MLSQEVEEKLANILVSRIEEYKVKLEFMGKVIDFYIQSFEIVPDIGELDYIGNDYKQFLRRQNIIELNLIGHC